MGRRENRQQLEDSESLLGPGFIVLSHTQHPSVGVEQTMRFHQAEVMPGRKGKGC